MTYRYIFNTSGFNFYTLLFFFLALIFSSCTVSKQTGRKHAKFTTESPSSYYLGNQPNVRVVNAEGATRRLQDITIQELRNQSRSGGYFVIENSLDEGIRFDSQGGQLVMTGKEVPVQENDVFIKFNVIASMKQDGRTIITKKTGLLGTEKKRVPAIMTIMPVAFTVSKGHDILLDERQYDGKAVWTVNADGGGYPADFRRRYEIAIGEAVKKFLVDFTPTTTRHKVRFDYTDEGQKAIIDVARNGQVKEAAIELEDYVLAHSNSASAVYNLAVLNDVLGRYDQALNYYDRALSLGGKNYYTKAKASCMKRRSEQLEMNSSQTTTRTNLSTSISSQNNQQEDRVNDIAWLQSTLNELGYECGVADGVMGSNTRGCIEAYQEANGLSITGSLNPETTEALNELR